MDTDFWEEVERAKKLTPEQKFLGTMTLFEILRELMVAGIRTQHPDADEVEVQQHLVNRYQFARQMETLF
jgi:hypothetical protein